MTENTHLELLQRLVALPQKPIAVPTVEDWERIEASLRVGLPKDFRELVGAYGIGSFCDFVHLLSPAAQGTTWNLRSSMADHLDAFRDLKASGYLSYPVYPEKDGCLPWTWTLNGDVICWRVHGTSDSWTVVVNTSRTDWFEQFDENATTFIYKCLSGQLKPKAFPANAFDKLFFRQPQEF